MQSLRAISVVILSILFGLTVVDCGGGNSSQAGPVAVTQPTQTSGPTPPTQPPSTPPPQVANFTVLHDFNCNGQDGAFPGEGLSTDQAGNLYGTTEGGGADGLGTAFKLTNTGSGWDYAVLYNFQGSPGGSNPEASVSVAPNGSLYGTTAGGGNTNCLGYCGTVFSLTPPVWTETSIFHFGPSGGGTWPRSDLVFDQAGNIYGTTFSGGNVCGVRGCGVVYELSPSSGGWTESVLHKFALTFNGSGDGVGPVGGVVFDQAGNLYGAAGAGGVSGCGLGCGAIYQLTPSPGGWIENVLYRFQIGSDGVEPRGGLIIDRSGNLYGTTSGRGSGGGGTVFQLSPSSGGWQFTVLYSLPGQGNGPTGTLVMDPAGNLYGMSYGNGANGAGSVFKLTPSEGGWTYTSLYDFTGGSDGKNPIGNLTLHTNGKLYGTTNSGGACGAGAVFEITP